MDTLHSGESAHLCPRMKPQARPDTQHLPLLTGDLPDAERGTRIQSEQEQPSRLITYVQPFLPVRYQHRNQTVGTTQNVIVLLLAEEITDVDTTDHGSFRHLCLDDSTQSVGCLTNSL